MEDDMAGVKIEQGTLTHRKTLRLKGLLGIGVAQAVGHLTMLWVWAANSTKDGSLAGNDARRKSQRFPGGQANRPTFWRP